MTYVDGRYISVARKNEVEHHEHTMKKLRSKIAWLTKSVNWELEQHHSRLKELQQLEDTLANDDHSFKPAMNTSCIAEPVASLPQEDRLPMDNLLFPAMNTEPTLKPGSSSRRRRTKTKKTVKRSGQKPATQLVA